MDSNFVKLKYTEQTFLRTWAVQLGSVGDIVPQLLRPREYRGYNEDDV